MHFLVSMSECRIVWLWLWGQRSRPYNPIALTIKDFYVELPGGNHPVLLWFTVYHDPKDTGVTGHRFLSLVDQSVRLGRGVRSSTTHRSFALVGPVAWNNCFHGLSAAENSRLIIHPLRTRR